MSVGWCPVRKWNPAVELKAEACFLSLKKCIHLHAIPLAFNAYYSALDRVNGLAILAQLAEHNVSAFPGPFENSVVDSIRLVGDRSPIAETIPVCGVRRCGVGPRRDGQSVEFRSIEGDEGNGTGRNQVEFFVRTPISQHQSEFMA